MFGLIPRSVWSRTTPVDDRGRITVAHNCLLLERIGPGSSAVPHPRRILIEAGTGDKLDPKMRDVFSLQTDPTTGLPRTVETALGEIGIAPESIDAAIISHLHFDHAGGLTRLPRAGETPAFPVPPNDDGGGGSSQRGGCVLTFPAARIYVQEREYADAIANRSVMTRTYYPDHVLPIIDRVVKIDSPRPFPFGYTPDRDELPRTTIEQRMTEVVPGLHVFLVPGHTWGQQAVMFREPDAPGGKAGGVGGRTIVFTPDVMPTAAHVGAAYSLAYDVEPYTSMISRRWLLTEAAARGWVLHLDHEPGHPLFRVEPDGKGWFRLLPEPL